MPAKRSVLTFPMVAMVLRGTSARAFDEELRTIATRPGVSLPFLLVAPDRRPVASLILFAGGNGLLGVANWATGGGRQGNFLVRSRGLFAERGFLVAVVDAPSDRAADGLTVKGGQVGQVTRRSRGPGVLGLLPLPNHYRPSPDVPSQGSGVAGSRPPKRR